MRLERIGGELLGGSGFSGGGWPGVEDDIVTMRLRVRDSGLDGGGFGGVKLDPGGRVAMGFDTISPRYVPRSFQRRECIRQSA